MRVIYNDLVDVSRDVTFAATSVDKPTLYRDCDVLSIHVTMRPGNENLVGREQIALMKPSAILINTSRGEVLDAGALAEAIREQRLAARQSTFTPRAPAGGFPVDRHLKRAADAASGQPNLDRDAEHELGGEGRDGGFERAGAGIPGGLTSNRSDHAAAGCGRAAGVADFREKTLTQFRPQCLAL